MMQKQTNKQQQTVSLSREQVVMFWNYIQDAEQWTLNQLNPGSQTHTWDLEVGAGTWGSPVMSKRPTEKVYWAHV